MNKVRKDLERLWVTKYGGIWTDGKRDFSTLWWQISIVQALLSHVHCVLNLNFFPNHSMYRYWVERDYKRFWEGIEKSNDKGGFSSHCWQNSIVQSLLSHALCVLHVYFFTYHLMNIYLDWTREQKILRGYWVIKYGGIWAVGKRDFSTLCWQISIVQSLLSHVHCVLHVIFFKNYLMNTYSSWTRP